MTTAIAAAPNGSSPFDVIRREDEQGEFWHARELAPILGYDKWQRFEDVLDRAKTSCEVHGFQPSEHFTGAGKSIAVPKGGRRNIEDVRLSRYGAYLVAMNGDPRKPAIAAAQSYFVIQTRRAELHLQPLKAPPRPEGPWSTRFIHSLRDHKRELYIAYPDGFTVISAISTELLCIEQSLHEHLLPTGADDLPDGSVGSRCAGATTVCESDDQNSRGSCRSIY